MNHISILIVDDDLNKISNIIKTIKEVFTEILSISQAICVQEAIENLQTKEFHLLITDLQMPLKYDDTPNDSGGKSLIKEIYNKRNNLNVPIYIVGLTQFEELKKTYEGVWKIWYYNSSSESWKVNLRDLINHISLIKNRVKTNKIETIFVEGPTDKKIIEYCFSHYFKDYIEKVYIDTINFGGGVNWVERQLFIWAKSLTINPSEEGYLKAVGVFDDDEAGRTGIENIKKQIDTNSAEFKTFSVLKTSNKYSEVLDSIKRKGITFPNTIEDLISIEVWKSAKSNGWLTQRDKNKINIDYTILDFKNEDLSVETLKENNFTEDEILIINYKIHDDYKKQFCNLVCVSDKNTLISISYLIKDILCKLKIIRENRKEIK